MSSRNFAGRDEFALRMRPQSPILKDMRFKPVLMVLGPGKMFECSPLDQGRQQRGAEAVLALFRRRYSRQLDGHRDPRRG